MLQELTPFVMKHWALSGAFVVVFILVVIEEIRAGGAGSSSLSPAQATQLINREDAAIIDVRDTNAFREGHIAGAKNILLADFDRGIEKLNHEKPVILVDAMGEKTSALLARLKKAGFQKAFAIKNGIDGWKSSDMPLIK